MTIANNLDFKLFAKDHQVVNNYTWLTLMLDSCSLMLYSYGQVLHGSLGKGFSFQSNGIHLCYKWDKPKAMVKVEENYSSTLWF